MLPIDNELDEGGQFSSGTLNSNRGHLHWEEWDVWKAKPTDRLVSAISHHWRWAFLRLLWWSRKKPYRGKWIFWKDVRFLNPEDRGGVWRRIRLEWWERKITHRGFWSDWSKEMKENECAIVEVQLDTGKGGVMMVMTVISKMIKSIILNYPYSLQITSTFILSFPPPPTAYSTPQIHRDGKS